MKARTLLGAVLTALALTACNNYFHELMPSDENRIVSFQLPGQADRAEITENSVTIAVDKGALKTPLIPGIAISRQATIVPLTYEYLTAAFPNVEMPKGAVAIYQTPDINEYVLGLIENEPDFNIPSLDMPIDFSGPVGFVVVSGRGSVRQYTVYAVEDDGMPRLLSFGFSKYDNPELMRDALSRVDEHTKTAGAQVLYPVAIPLSYALVPSFLIMGDRLEVDGAETRTGFTAVQFDSRWGMQNKTITVWRNGVSVTYNLLVEFDEDTDSLYSITDFRFNTGDNPAIAATAVGSIIDNENFGTISVQVFYSGARPSVMIPRFISPGKVFSGDIEQYSGAASHDFSQPVEYLVISQNNYYTRRYTVRVEFIDIAALSPVITSFNFSAAVNPELVQDSKGEISDSAGIIMITARYGGLNAPEFLIPQFTATGLVTVMGITQSSGYSAQDFTRQLKYTVSSPTNPLLARDYWVQVSFVRDTSSAAMIKTFSFHPAENPGLMDEIPGKIDQVAGTIIVNAPVGSGVVSKIMIPRFTADGQVVSGDSVQVSGISAGMFDVPVPYAAVSANGAVRRDYTVTVRELGTTIYVDSSALGLSNGTNWKDAFRTILQACDAAALFDEDVPKEIWIAKGNYTANGGSFNITANTSYLGGFAGNEISKSERNTAANKVNVTGPFKAAAKVSGDVSFEHLYLSSGGIAVEDTGGRLSINTLEVRDTGGAGVAVNNGNVEINGLELNNITGNGIQLYGSGVRNLSRVNGRNISGNPLRWAHTDTQVRLTRSDFDNLDDYWDYLDSLDSIVYPPCAGTLNITDSTFDSTGQFYLNYASGYTVTTAIQGVTISNSKAASTAPLQITNNGSGAFNLDVTIPNAGALPYTIYYSGSSANFTIDKAVISNSQATSSAVYISAGSGIASVNNAQVSGASGKMGRGIQAASSNRVRISNSSFKNCTVTGSYGGGIYLSGTGVAEISGTTIDNAKASTGGGIYTSSAAALTVTNSTIQNTQSEGSGGGIYARIPRLTLNGVTFKNCYAGGSGTDGSGSGGGVYLSDTDGAQLVIEGARSRFENCRATSSGGAIYNPSYGWDTSNDNYRPYNNHVSVANTDFFNCAAYNGPKLFYGEGDFNNCTFEDDDSVYIYPKSQDIEPMFRSSRGRCGYFNFVNCTFGSLRNNENKGGRGNNAAFDRYIDLASNSIWDYLGGTWELNHLGKYRYDITFRDCTFNPTPESETFLYNTSSGAYYSGGSYEGDNVLFDGCLFNYNYQQSSAVFAKSGAMWNTRFYGWVYTQEGTLAYTRTTPLELKTVLMANPYQSENYLNRDRYHLGAPGLGVYNIIMYHPFGN